MSWVQIGTHKVNTAAICYVEQEGETVRIYFHGEWEGNPLDLHFDEAKAFWKHLKAEDVMIGRDKGSATVLPKLRTGGYEVYDDTVKPKPTAGSGSNNKPSSGSSHTSHSRPHESHRHGDAKRH